MVDLFSLALPSETVAAAPYQRPPIASATTVRNREVLIERLKYNLAAWSWLPRSPLMAF